MVPQHRPGKEPAPGPCGRAPARNRCSGIASSDNFAPAVPPCRLPAVMPQSVRFALYLAVLVARTAVVQAESEMCTEPGLLFSAGSYERGSPVASEPKLNEPAITAPLPSPGAHTPDQEPAGVPSFTDRLAMPTACRSSTRGGCRSGPSAPPAIKTAAASSAPLASRPAPGRRAPALWCASPDDPQCAPRDGAPQGPEVPTRSAGAFMDANQPVAPLARRIAARPLRAGFGGPLDGFKQRLERPPRASWWGAVAPSAGQPGH